ncbi:MAG: methyl-accepting chemotaxis protein [Bacillota bacterium]
MKSIGSKITAAFIAGILLVTVVIGGVSTFLSSQAIKELAEKNLLLTSQYHGAMFNQVMSDIEHTVNGLSTTILSEFDLQEMKQDASYMQNYQDRIDLRLKYLAETTEGTMEIYLSFNPELTGDVYGGAYVDTSGNKKFEKLSLESIEEFNPNNPDMEWYYKAVQEKKAVWMDPYYYEEFKVDVISYVKPIYIDNILIGVAGIDVNFEHVKNEVNSIKAYDTGYAALLSSDYDFLSHPALTRQDNLKTMEDGTLNFMAEHMEQSDSGVLEYSYKGAEKILGYARLSNGYILLTNAPLSEIFQKQKEMVNFMLILIAASVVLGTMIALVTSRTISKPIVKITKVINKTAHFDLTDDRTYEDLLTYKDEIGTISNAVWNMRTTLSNMVQNIQESSTQVSNYSISIAGATEESSAAVEGIARAADELAEGASNQSENVQQGVHSLDVLASKIDDMVKSSGIMKEYVENTKLANEQGMVSINELYSSVQANNDVSKQVSSQVNLLEEKSNHIGEITNTIKSIAEQTNLLALNAAIEAARAGDAGKGFSVVAEEIRKLSDETATSTQNIDVLIKQIQEEVKNTQQKIYQAAEITDKTNRVSLDTGKAFEQIDLAVKGIIGQIDGIIHNINSIDKDKNNVVSIIQDISAVAEEAAASSEEVSASVEEQTATMESIASTAGELQHLAERLQSLVSNFKL